MCQSPRPLDTLPVYLFSCINQLNPHRTWHYLDLERIVWLQTDIGFIETYVDPYGGRAEWESFTAIVNKTLSAKYDKLVDSAGELIKELPWGPDFEVDSFRRPDFTALEITSFTTAGIPAGINIPKYVTPPAGSMLCVLVLIA